VGKKATIMVVDDDDMVASVVSLMLAELGYQAEVVNSPQKALDMFSGDPERFDLVLTDLTMPEMNGIELAKRLKAARNDVIIVVMSGFGGASGDEADPDNIDRFLPKPLLLDDLSQALDELLKD